MKLPILILTLVFSCRIYAQEICELGSSPLQAQKLTDELSLSVVAQQPANTLHWKIIRNKDASQKGADSMTAGEAVLPGEKYAYYWDPEQRVFWFATVRSIFRGDFSNWISTKSVTRSTKGLDTYKDLPSPFRDNVRKVLE